jgi:Asp-tRNA(Asn)/Glu-tRNA(Gln) amidotransferase B subunit
MPVVAVKYQEDYSKIWKDILEEDAVSSVIYDPGKQQGTVFNRNLVAQISRMMARDGIIVKETKDVAMAELLEPQRGKHHPVRKQLAFIPDDNKIKKAVKEVFKKHGVEVP